MLVLELLVYFSNLSTIAYKAVAYKKKLCVITVLLQKTKNCVLHTFGRNHPYQQKLTPIINKVVVVSHFFR